jgi:hypothetical protein
MPLGYCGRNRRFYSRLYSSYFYMLNNHCTDFISHETQNVKGVPLRMGKIGKTRVEKWHFLLIPMNLPTPFHNFLTFPAPWPLISQDFPRPGKNADD